MAVKRKSNKKTRTSRIVNHVVRQTKPGKKPKNWLTALLLSVFLGYLGIDRFYIGYTGTGILKLLVTLLTFGILGWLWWLVDLILIATRYDFDRVSWN